MTSVGTLRPSATGARVFGDDFQFLVALEAALRAASGGENIVAIEIEAPDVRTVDDVVVRHRVPPDEYEQVKGSVSAREALSTAYLLTLDDNDGPSLLQKIHRAWVRLTKEAGGVRPRLKLTTTRSIDSNDPLLCELDRHETLAAALKSMPGHANRSEAAAGWATHLGVDLDGLSLFLGDLRFVVRGSEASWRDAVALRLAALGYDRSDVTIDLCVGMVRGWVKDGRRRLTPVDIRDELRMLGIQRGTPTALIVIEAIDRCDVGGRDVTVRLNWLGEYIGTVPSERILLREPEHWNGRLSEDLGTAAATARGLGFKRVEFEGTVRLPGFFAAGATFREVAGWSVTLQRHDLAWDSLAVDTNVAVPLVDEINQGDDVAVILQVAAEIRDEVGPFLRSAGLPVRDALYFNYPGGAGPRAVTDARLGVGFARSVRELVRKRAAPRVHLFLSTPAGLALVLGNFWDRMPPTQTYDWVGSGRGYSPAFLIR